MAVSSSTIRTRSAMAGVLPDGDADRGLRANPGPAGNAELASMQLSQAANNHDSDAAALLFVPPALELHEAADPCDLLGGHSSTLVGHSQFVHPSRAAAGDRDRASGSREFESVARQFLDGGAE